MTEIPLAATVDSTYNAADHAPFAPVERGNLPTPTPGAWTCEGVQHGAETETENYELRDGEWVHTGTDTGYTPNHHELTWHTENGLPSLPDSREARVVIEYADKAIHMEAGEPTHTGPGYIVYAMAARDGEKVGEYNLGTFENLAGALRATGTYLREVDGRDGPLPGFNPEGGMSLDDLLDSLGLPVTPE